MALLETLSAAFKGGKNSRVPLAPGYLPAWAASFAGANSRQSYDYGQAVRDGFLTNPIAQRAVRIVAEGVGQAPITITDPKLKSLVMTTSAGQSLIETIAAHVLLHGNSFVQIMKDGLGQPIELFALRPDRVEIIAGSDGWPTAYEYGPGHERARFSLEDDNGWPNIIHIKAMHPIEDMYGAGALAAANEAIAIHNAAAEWNRTLLENAARPSGALVYDSDDGLALSAEQFDRLKDELATAFTGSANAGRPMLLDGGLKWQSIALSPADMDFATLKSAAARDISLAFGVPPMLLGLPGDNTYSNYREANRALWRLTLLPLAEKVFAALREGLAPWFKNADIGIDLDRVPALSEDRERLWKQVSDADFLSDEEKRSLLGIAVEGAQS